MRCLGGRLGSIATLLGHRDVRPARIVEHDEAPSFHLQRDSPVAREGLPPPPNNFRSNRSVKMLLKPFGLLEASRRVHALEWLAQDKSQALWTVRLAAQKNRGGPAPTATLGIVLPDQSQ